MKIICDSCGAKYSIADEKVQGKVFKIRCKKCSDVIVVKGAEEASDADQDYGSYDNGGGAAEWYVVIDGERVGPITPEEVNAYFTAGQLESSTYVWRDGLDDWVMLETLSEFAHLTQHTAGPEEATMISTRSTAGDADFGSAASDSDYGSPAGDAGYDGVQDYSGSQEYGGDQNYGAGQEYGVDQDYGSAQAFGSSAGAQVGGYEEPDAGDSTMVMDSGRFQKSEFESFGSESAATDESGGHAAIESGSYGSVAGADPQPAAETNGRAVSGAGSFAGEPAQDYNDGYDSGGYDDGQSFDSGGFDDGGGYDSGGYDDGGGYEAEQGGMFAAFDSGESSEQDDYQSDDYGQQDASPDLSGGDADNLVGARNENSVLFSLSSVDQVQAVSKPTGAGQAEGSDKSGLIDIQALASTHAAMKGGGADEDEDEFVAGTMSVPALMPMGSHKSNKGLIIGVTIGAIVLVLGMGGIIVALLMNNDSEEEITQPEVIAQAEPEQEEKEEEELSEEEQAEADEAAAAAEAALAEQEATEEEEEEEEAEEEEVAAAAPSRPSRPSRPAPSPSPPPSRPAPTPERESSGGSILDDIDQGRAAAREEPEESLPDSLSRSMVQSTIRRYNSQVSNCSSSSNSGGLSGRANVRFVVAGSGSVSSASAQGEFAGTDVGGCIENVVKGMRFPATQDDQRSITYPFAVR